MREKDFPEWRPSQLSGGWRDVCSGQPPAAPPDPGSTLFHSALCPGRLTPTECLPGAPLPPLPVTPANGRH